MNTIPWDLRFHLASNQGRGPYFPPLPLASRKRSYPRDFLPDSAMTYQTRTVLRALLLLALTIAVVGFAIFMHIPYPYLPEIAKQPSTFFIPLDKLFHFASYFLLSVLLCAWVWVGRVPPLRRQVFWIIAGLMIYSGLEEYTQQFSYRVTDMKDWFADVLGFTLGCLMMWAIWRFGPRWLSVTEPDDQRVAA